MYFVGLDLAWGQNRQSGIAVVDGGGRLAYLGAGTDDDSIVTALRPYADDECLVAIDAPLVVNNATGQRPCEASLNRDFRRFDAGAHPSNTSKPELAGTPRGARVAAALGLDIDPMSQGPRRVIEVYPHPASIALFGLGRILKYKHKRGRAFDELKSELLQLIRLIEERSDAEVPMRVADHPEWTRLRTTVQAATRKFQLRLVEDVVDAALCAYVALYATRRPDDVTVYGDVATGYIVTPTLV